MHLHCTCKGICHVEEYSVEVIIFQGTLISPFLFLTMHGSLKAPVYSCKSQQFPLSRWNNLYRKTFWFGMTKTFFSVEIKNLICVNSSNESWFLLFFFPLSFLVMETCQCFTGLLWRFVDATAIMKFPWLSCVLCRQLHANWRSDLISSARHGTSSKAC